MTNEQIAEIAKNMSKGDWIVDPENKGHSMLEIGVIDKEVYAGGYLVIAGMNSNYYQIGKANAAAICVAVNATWGANINPEKIGDAVKFLEFIAEKLPSESERQFFGVTTYSIPFTFAEIKEIQNLLHDLKIKP